MFPVLLPHFLPSLSVLILLRPVVRAIVGGGEGLVVLRVRRLPPEQLPVVLPGAVDSTNFYRFCAMLRVHEGRLNGTTAEHEVPYISVLVTC